MKLVDIIAALDQAEVSGPIDKDITSLVYDSRKITKGALFCCIKGENFDGHAFAEEAVKKGAAAFLVERQLNISAPQIMVKDVRAVLGSISKVFYNYPDKDLKILGVTGTNGKTTVTWVLSEILNKVGIKCQVIGTLNSERTTPEAPDLFEKFSVARSNGVNAIAMEVSSHGLDQNRVKGIIFEVAGFTNLSPEHLDYHKNMTKYFEAKAKLFDKQYSKNIVIYDNEDKYSKKLISMTLNRDEKERLIMKKLEYPDVGIQNLKPYFNWFGKKVVLKWGGIFSAIDAYIAGAMALKLGVDERDIAGAIAECEPVPGRFSVVVEPNPFCGTVIVDYAHSPDALRAALESARELTKGELIVVFGAGGQRDKKKRPLMGEIASKFADFVIVTSDNPRYEDSLQIIADITKGIEGSESMAIVEEDRSKAIKRAVLASRPGDVVLIAGKGHEEYQEIKGKKIQFSDSKEAKKIFEVLCVNCA
jgi:UDP-N-acetylmuramoyl-L-alanyl-D-glutamate--2,6-diaminopimelate ligase